MFVVATSDQNQIFGVIEIFVCDSWRREYQKFFDCYGKAMKINGRRFCFYKRWRYVGSQQKICYHFGEDNEQDV